MINPCITLPLKDRLRLDLTMVSLGERTTLCYKRITLMDQSSDLPLYLDIHHPSWKKSDNELTPHHRSDLLVPAVVYFHGGGLTVGNRDSWLPNWLKSQ